MTLSRLAPSIREMLEVNGKIRVPLRELRFEFARSGGPGGQHVNKTETRATLRWQVRDTRSLPDDVFQIEQPAQA